MTYALDTNIVIRLLRNEASVFKHFTDAINSNANIAIPPIVNYELLRGFYYRPAPAKEKAYRIMCSHYPVGEMTNDIWERGAVIYADLRRSGRTVEDADILIAAYCIVNGFTFVTHNTRHFEVIEDLQIEDWVE